MVLLTIQLALLFKTITMKTHIIYRNTVLLLALLLLSSCAASLRYWEEATDEFNQAAQLEMEQRLAQRRATADTDIPPLEVSPRLGEVFQSSQVAPTGTPLEMYQQAYDKIQQALETPDILRQEEKLGNAYTIKALAAWKIGQIATAEAAAAQALEIFPNQSEPSPRDEALARAIPGLITLDIAYDSSLLLIQRLKDASDAAEDMTTSASQALLQEAQAHYRKYVADENERRSVAMAINDLEAAIAIATDNQPLRTYLRLAQLSGLKTRYDLWNQINNFAKRSGLKQSDTALRQWLDAEETAYLSLKDSVLDKLHPLLTQGKESEIYRYWDSKL